MKLSIPKEILSQHTAVLGKTGSGKTSTAKLLIEQVVAEGARVCVLDPIKSDWWGLTSSADGKKAGLPFHILGGPRGHVPLHASAGKVIGEIVANGALPLSIIDMADFEPGGQAKFFVDFAPTLLRKMRGVVYLVIEEAHLFAPKERSGIGAENLSIHWSKTLATAGRSKGVRLVLVTQRTQALHNALLGSCDTMIVHRLTAPADQEPVIKWLKSNVREKEIRDQVTNGMSSLKTGSGWLCAGEAKIFELIDFPRIKTYDNTATPTGDGDTREIKTAAVDQEKLRAIIGDAVDQAKADDPRELRKQIADLKSQVAQAVALAHGSAQANPKKELIRQPILTDADRALLENIALGLDRMSGELAVADEAVLSKLTARIDSTVTQCLERMNAASVDARDAFIAKLDTKGFQKILGKLATVESFDPNTRVHIQPRQVLVTRPVVTPRRAEPRPFKEDGQVGSLPPGEHATLTAALQYPDGLDKKRLGILTGYKRSSRDAYIARLAQKGLVESRGAFLYPTDAGRASLNGSFEPLPTGKALIAYWRDRLPEGERATLDVLLDHGQADVARETIDERTGYKRSSRDAYLTRLKARGLVEFSGRGMVRASEELFS